MNPFTSTAPATSSRLRSIIVTYEPINHATVTHHFLGTTRSVIAAAASHGRELAARLGVSPMALAIAVREG